MQLIKTTIISVIISLLCVTMSYGQRTIIDSLESVLNKHQRGDTAKVNLLNKLAYESFMHAPQKTCLYAQQAMELSLKLNYRKGEAASLWVSGLATLRSDKKESLNNFHKALKIAENIDDRVGMCNYLTAIGSVLHELGDIKTSTGYHERALGIARELNDTRMTLRSLANMYINFNATNNYVEAVKYLQQSIKLSEEVGDDHVLARSYGVIALIYQKQGDYPSALGYYISALQVNEKINNNSNIANNLINIAGLQSDNNEPDLALKTIQKALQICQQHGDSVNMSICYTNLGNIYKKINDPQALSYFQKALTSKNVKGSMVINILMNMGEIYSSEGDTQQAIKNLNEALVLAKKVNVKSYITQVYVVMGGVYLKEKNYKTAIDYINKSLAMAESIHQTEVQKNCYLLLSDAYAALGNFMQAYQYHKQYTLLNDIIFNEKNTRKMTLLESSYQFDKERKIYEFEKQDRELRIKSQKQTIISLIIISLLVLMLTFAIYWSGRLRKRVLRFEIEKINQELEANQKAIAVAKLKLLQNSERDAHHIKILEDIGKNVEDKGRQNLNSLVNNYKLQANQSNWDEFETLFTKVNASFFEKMNESYPNLTPKERKLCVFLKLNMSNKDISLITFQTEEALKKSRLRLRQKLGIDRSTNLTAFVHNI